MKIMNNNLTEPLWVIRAIQTLERSLFPTAQELNELDWKARLSENNERLAQHLSAFANLLNGGFLVFGLDNEAKIVHLTKNDMDKIIQTLGNIARNNLEPPVTIEHATTDFRGNTLLIIYIQESSSKPVHIRGKSLYESYKRSAGQTVKLSPSEIKNVIVQSSGLDFESQIALSYQDADDVLELLDYDSYFRLQNKRLPENKTGILEALEQDDLIKKNADKWDILNLGAILFARKLSTFKTLSRKVVRVIVYKATDRINALKEQEGGKGYASGFEGLINYLMNELPANEVIEDALRKEVKIFPEVAVREFVANALIHQDFYSVGTRVMIEIFTDRIEITNPGSPLIDTKRFIDAPPKSRNEKLASLMRRLNICEERGSGIDRAINAIEVYQLPAPKFIQEQDYTKIIMYAPVSLAKMSQDDRIRACYQHTCLHYISNQPVNNQSVRKRFGIGKNNASMASKIISETIDASLIKPADPNNQSKKFATYVPYWA